MSGTALQNAKGAMVPDAKVRDYLLDQTHPDNGGNAGMHVVVNVATNPWGIKYEVRCNLPSPDRRNPCVRSFWLIDAPVPIRDS